MFWLKAAATLAARAAQVGERVDPGGAGRHLGRTVRRSTASAPKAAWRAARATAARAEQRELWRLTVEHSPVGMCLVSPTGVMWMPNRAFADMIGYPQDQLRELTFQDITHPEDLDEDLDLLAATLRGQRSSYRLTKRFLHADGSVVWGDLSVALMRSGDGEPLHFISQVLDVTSQHLDREGLAATVVMLDRERSLARAVLETVDVGLMLVDCDGRPERVNRRQHQILDMAHPRSQPRGVDPPASDAVPAVTASGQSQGAFEGSSVWEETCFFRADGVTPLPLGESPTARAVRGEEFDDQRVWVGPDAASRRALSVSARTARDEVGQATGAALAFSDVTDLVQALTAREVFERSVSHELRTPLTSVLGHLELVLDHEDLPDTVVRQLRVVQRNAARLQYLVSDLLDTAARASGSLELVLAPVDVTALVSEVVDAARPAARAAGVTLTTMAEVAAARVEVDAHRIVQVVENLLSNAVKYTDTGGQVDVTIEADPDADEVTITVSDTGIGIAAEDLGRLYEPFFRAQDARERTSPGVGLGLGIARAIVFAHGGRLEVASQPGQGTSFTAAIPTHPAHHGTAAAPPKRP